MKESDIRKYAQLMKELELTGLEITENDQVVRLERNVAVPVAPTVPVEAVPTPVQQEPADGISVTSPMVGLFYAAPAENAEPYVTLGDQVKKGQTVCLIEAMKMMSEVPAPCDCVVEEVLKANGDLAAFGEALFRYKPC